MTDILSVAERVWGFLEGIVREEMPSDKETALFYATFRKEAQYFEMGPHLTEAIHEIAKDVVMTRDGLGGGVVSQNARLPAPYTVIWGNDLKDNMLCCMKEEGSSDKIKVALFSSHAAPLALGQFSPGNVETHLHVSALPALDTENVSQELKGQILVYAAASLTLINTPRLITRVLAGTRQSRRAIGRRTGAEADQWHRIEWDLTKPQMRAGEKMGTGWHMPLHYTRGHWRQNDKAKNNAHVRADGRTYQWIEGYWSGHPAYGIKRAVYAPRLGEKIA
jgi:hypothetical protein